MHKTGCKNSPTCFVQHHHEDGDDDDDGNAEALRINMHKTASENPQEYISSFQNEQRKHVGLREGTLYHFSCFFIKL